jgi:hypothetical protein
MRLVSGIVLAIILSLMLWMTKESTSHLHEDRERDRDRKGWSFNRLSKWPSAVIWTILNLIASLLILSLTMGVRYTFIGGLWEIIIVGLFGIFSLFVIIGIIISRFDFIGWKFSWFVLLGIVFWVVLLLTSLAIIPKPSGVVSNISHFLDKPGTLFVAILGLITITGFIVTISQLHETNARITDYPTLLRRLTFLLEEAVGPATGWRSLSPIGKIARKFRVLCGHEFENDEHVRIYVRTLALGSMSTPKQVFDRYGRALKDLFAHGKSMVVQLDHSNLPDIPSSKEDISKIEPILSQS